MSYLVCTYCGRTKYRNSKPVESRTDGISHVTCMACYIKHLSDFSDETEEEYIKNEIKNDINNGIEWIGEGVVLEYPKEYNRLLAEVRREMGLDCADGSRK